MEDFSYIYRLNKQKMSTKNQIFENLLKDFKKANKERREKIALKNGFKSAADYQKHLEENIGKVEEAPKKATKPSKKATKESEVFVDKVIAFDTTGSMSEYIEAVRKHVAQLIPELFANTPNLRLKIVAFGDYCDMTGPKEFGFAYQESQFTDNQDQLIKFVNKTKNTGGGDSDEFYELVIKKIVDETPWREGSSRSVLLIGDYAPHPSTYSFKLFGQEYSEFVDWRQEARKAASLGIQFDTLKIRPEETFYDELSTMTNGVCMPFKSSQKTAEAIYASTLVRGSAKSKKVFTESMTTAMASGDEELIGMYKSLSKKL